MENTKEQIIKEITEKWTEERQSLVSFLNDVITQYDGSTFNATTNDEHLLTCLRNYRVPVVA